MTTQTMNFQKPLSELEQLLATGGAEFETNAPEQHARVKRLVGGLKKATGATLSAELERDLLEIYRWQLQMQKDDYAQQIEVLKDSVKSGDPLAKQADAALRKVVEVLTLGLQNVSSSPSPEVQAKVEETAAAAQKALTALNEAYLKRLGDASMRPVPGGQIVSPSGVALKAVVPSRALSEKPQSFRVLPGTKNEKK